MCYKTLRKSIKKMRFFSGRYALYFALEDLDNHF